MISPAPGKNTMQYRRFLSFHSDAGIGTTVYMDSMIRKDCKIFKNIPPCIKSTHLRDCPFIPRRPQTFRVHTFRTVSAVLSHTMCPRTVSANPFSSDSSHVLRRYAAFYPPASAPVPRFCFFAGHAEPAPGFQLYRQSEHDLRHLISPLCDLSP